MKNRKTPSALKKNRQKTFRLPRPKKALFAAVIFLHALIICAQESVSSAVTVDTAALPLISFPAQDDSPETKREKNLIFKQFSEEAEYNAGIFPGGERWRKDGTEKEIYLSFYKVEIPRNMDFLWLSSRMSPVTKETIATLNNITSADEQIFGTTIIVPTFSGIFVPEKVSSAWESMLHHNFVNEKTKRTCRKFLIDGKKYYFFERERFNPTLLLYFLDTNMYPPVEESVLTSDFGFRISPVSGQRKFHKGIDLAVPTGTKVSACKAGTVAETGFDSVYGNYIIIKHFGGLSSLYAHLSKISVEKNQKISKGREIGKSGSTGVSTGPHLHFELRKNGELKNPGDFIKFK